MSTHFINYNISKSASYVRVLRFSVIITYILANNIFECSSQTIVINEFMSDNETTIQNSFGEFSDWVELHNQSEQTINIESFALSDNKDNLNKWIFPNKTIAANGYLIVFASGKDITDISELHSNFKLSSSGENLFLTDSLNIIVDSVSPINLSADEVYCRYPDGGDNWITSSFATPNYSNKQPDELSLSNKPGFYSKPFNLSITSYLGDSIFYTLDGSIPTTKSSLYSEAIPITNNSLNENSLANIPSTTNQSAISYKAWDAPNKKIDKATIVRYASFKNGRVNSEIHTQSYFIIEPNKYDLPIISLVTDSLNLFNYDTGIYIPGKYFDASNPEWTGNFFKSGNSWERPVHIEYFDENGLLCMNQDAGFRIHGGKTRQAAQKSLRLYARDEYGTKYFNYKLLPQRDNEQYKRILLRTGMAAWFGNTIIADVFAHELVSNLNIEFQYYQPAIVFINGEYWGIHTIRDRIDERYIEYISGYDKDSIDLITGNATIISGSNTNYIALMEFIDNNDISTYENYKYIESKIDVDNYIDYQIAETFLGNSDWPSNNMKLWKPQNNLGKWRWIFYDIDAGFSHYSKNMLIHATEDDESITWPNSSESTLLFRKLLTNNEFQDRFISRYSDLLNNDFSKDSMLFKLEHVKYLYDSEINRHSERWNSPSSYNTWEYDISKNILQFVENRPCYVKEHIESYFDLSNFGYQCSSSSNISSDFVVAPNPNTGNFNIINKSDNIFSGEFSLSTITGAIIYKNAYFNLNPMEKEECNINDLQNGIYILSISNASNNYFERRKIIITK